MRREELTPCELAVLRLLAEGKPNKLIGADLAIAEVALKSQVQSVFRKMNVLSRTEAIAVANRRGLLRLPSTSPTSRNDIILRATVEIDNRQNGTG